MVPKHTQTYALAFMVAIAAGFDGELTAGFVAQTRATYDVRYDGVSA